MPGFTPQPQAPIYGTSEFDVLMESIMKIWPDYAAENNLEPPADSGLVGQDTTVPPAQEATLPRDDRLPIPEPNPVPEQSAQIDPAMLSGTDDYRMQPTTNEQLFPTDVLQIPQGDINAAADITPPSNPLMAVTGQALSGIQTPQTVQNQAPSPPSIPATKDINPTLLAVLQAAGLTAPQTKPISALGR